jgi:hypothetical protein
VWTETPEPGYIVSGRWPFASGSSHATWFGAECLVYDGDQPRLDAAGEHISRMTFVPPSMRFATSTSGRSSSTTTHLASGTAW